jgi:hypothetical protein
MRSLSSFHGNAVNARGITEISYDGDAAGEHLAEMVCGTLQAAGQYEYASIIAASKHHVEGGAFDEESGEYEVFDWVITAPPDKYGELPSADARNAFKKAVYDLKLGILGPVSDIRLEVEQNPNQNWRATAQAAAVKATTAKRRTISPETIADFRNAASDFLSLRLIRDAFQVAGVVQGKYDDYVSGERRTLFMDYMASVEQSRDGDTEKLFKALSYMLNTVVEKGAPPERVEALRSRLAHDGFAETMAGVKPSPSVEQRAARSSSLVEDIIEYMRAVPRGLRELKQDNRYNKRPYSVVEIKDEYDLQDFVRAFLKMRFPRATVENTVSKVAGVGGRVDFSLGDEKVFIELKVLKDEKDWGGMLKDITSKFERYSKDQDCDDIIVFVYDPDACFRDAHTAEADITQHRSIGGREFDTYLVVAPKP